MDGTSTLTTMITSITEVVTGMVGWVGSVADLITGTPALMLPFGVSIGGAAIGLFLMVVRRFR